MRINGFPGRCYYFLKDQFPQAKWQKILKPTSDDFKAYRKYLAFSKPYFDNIA